MQTTDKLFFEKIALPNGHFLYTQKSDLPVTFIRIVIPVGNAHAHSGNQYCNEGYFHFLEHMCFESSKKYSNKSEYNNLLAKTGSRQNAWTDAFYTEFNFEAPAQTFNQVFPAFLNHLVEPAFTEEDIELQKGIIVNERTQRKFFPGTDELSQYTLTRWMDSQYYSREQIFGSDQSLDAITPELLKRNHEYYFSKPISIFVAGTFDLEIIINELESLPSPIGNRELAVKIHEPKWNNKNWHEFESTDIDTHIMHIGGIFDNYSVENVWGIDFILELLTHEEFGTLQTWIRKDNGWSYGLEPDIEYERDRIIWGIKIPLNSHSVADNIRAEIYNKINSSIFNSELIKSTKERLLLETCFDYETINSRLDRAVYVLNTAGYIPTQADYINWLSNINEEQVTSVYNQFFAPEHIGEFLAVPKTE